MAKRSLIHDAGARQLITKSRSTFVLKLTEAEWYLLCRLLTVGCGLSDDLLDVLNGRKNGVDGSRALLWQKLQKEFAPVIRAIELERPRVLTDDVTR